METISEWSRCWTEEVKMQDLKATALDKFEELKKTVFIELKESMMTMTQQISDRLKNK